MLILGSHLQPEAPSSFLPFTLSNELGRLCLVVGEWVSQMVSAVSFLFVCLFCVNVSENQIVA